MIRETALAALVASISLGMAACEKQGPAERVGEKVDHAVDTVKNGGKEPVADKVEDAAHDARDGVKDAADDLKKN
jgi:type II secretory pathway predicted ATPase ExeA